jgi:hypothetical protein
MKGIRFPVTLKYSQLGSGAIVSGERHAPIAENFARCLWQQHPEGARSWRRSSAAGWVADVAEVFTTCRIFVVPLKSGAGLKGKVIGALSHGVPSIISPAAMEGVGAAEGVDVLVAEKPQQWVQAIMSLYNEPEKWQAMSNAAQDVARRRYSFSAGRELMKAVLDHAQVFTSDEYVTQWA